MSEGDRIMVYGLAPDLGCRDAGDQDHLDARKRLRMVEERAVDCIADSEEASDNDQAPE